MTKLNVLIVGGGPVGLTTATALARDGHSVTVLEKRSGLQTIGGAFMVAANGVKAFRHVGMETVLEQNSNPLDTLIFTAYASPEILITNRLQSTERTCGIMRTDLQRISYETAVEAGAKVVFDQRVSRWDGDSAEPTVWTTDGLEYKSDIIIAADGIRSIVRKQMYPSESVDATVTNQVVFISFVAVETLSGDSRFAPYLNATECRFIMGPGVYIMTGMTRKGLWLGVFAMDSQIATHPDNINGRWNIAADPKVVQKLLEKFEDTPRDLISRATEWEQWHIGVAPDIESWSDKSGYSVLIGDAAHSFPPHAGQGLVQGVEDGATLARLLRYMRPERGRKDIPHLLKEFEALRRQRVSKIRDLAWELGVRQSLHDGPEQIARDTAFKRVNASSTNIDWSAIELDANAPTYTPQFQKWMRDYDVGMVVDQAMADYQWPN